MSEEPAAPEAEEAEATSEEEFSQDEFEDSYNEFVKFQNSNGKPSSGSALWRDSFTDEKLKTQAERYDSPQGMLENINKLQGEVSRRLKLPGEDTSDEDLSKYRKAIGVPDSPEGYEFKPGEGLEWSEEDKALLGTIGEIFHKNNVPVDGAVEAVEAYNALAREAVKQQAGNTQKAHDEAVSELKREWGSEYEGNVNLVAQFRERVTDENFKAFLEEGKLASGALVADDPAMVRFLARMARATEESELMLGVSGGEARTLQEQIDELEKENPPGTEGYKDPSFQRKLTSLYDKRYGSESVVGRDQRF